MHFALLQELSEFFIFCFVYYRSSCNSLLGRRQVDNRTWTQRRQHEFSNWDECMDELVVGYLEWKYPPSTTHASSSSAMPCTSPTASSLPLPSPPSTPQNVTNSHPYTINVYDIIEKINTLTILRPSTSTNAAVDFIKNGYLTKTPLAPNSALSIRSLELFHHMRLRKPSFSMDACAKMIADIYMVRTTTYFLFGWIH